MMKLPDRSTNHTNDTNELIDWINQLDKNIRAICVIRGPPRRLRDLCDFCGSPILVAESTGDSRQKHFIERQGGVADNRGADRLGRPPQLAALTAANVGPLETLAGA